MTFTLRQLADHLGLSQTTVSRALNGFPEVSERTREKVQAAAKELGYVPNPRARGLATGRSMSIGHIIPLPRDTEVSNPIFGDFLAGAGEVYSRHGYSAHLGFCTMEDEAEHYRKLLTHRTVDGVVLHLPRSQDTRIALLSSLGLPFAMHGRASDIDVPYSFVDTDNEAALHMATAHLLEHGHERIALLNGPRELSFSEFRFRGYARALAQAGCSVRPDHVSYADMTEDYGYSVTSRLLQQDVPPTAYLASSMLVAIGTRRALRDQGLEIGRDVSIVAHDDVLSYLPNTGDPPAFTVTRSGVGDAGARLAEHLIARIENADLPEEQIVLPPQLILGRSSGPLGQTLATARGR